MWIWECEIRRLGFRSLSAGYWQCQRRYGLPAGAYLSAFAHATERQPPSESGSGECVDICAFHVTFCLGIDRVHFYFHEVAEGVWEPGGHTSAAEIRRYRRDPLELRAGADRVAAEFLAALEMTLMPRGSEGN